MIFLIDLITGGQPTLASIIYVNKLFLESKSVMQSQVLTIVL